MARRTSLAHPSLYKPHNVVLPNGLPFEDAWEALYSYESGQRSSIEMDALRSKTSMSIGELRKWLVTNEPEVKSMWDITNEHLRNAFMAGWNAHAAKEWGEAVLTSDEAFDKWQKEKS